jgi:hypothetical protein
LRAAKLTMEVRRAIPIVFLVTGKMARKDIVFLPEDTWPAPSEAVENTGNCFPDLYFE